MTDQESINESNGEEVSGVSNVSSGSVSSNAFGVDPGTAFFQTANYGQDGKVNIKCIRNAFVELDESDDVEDVLTQNNWRYVNEGSKYYVVGEDAIKVARMFPGKVELRRPLKGGVLNKDEDKKMLILSNLIESTIGSASGDHPTVCACISSESADQSQDATFHKARLQGMFKRLGYDVKIIEEGLAVVLSEKPSVTDADGNESKFSGIGVSFGGGRANCVLAYKGLQVVGASVARAGDYIDNAVAKATGVPVAQVTGAKEKKLNFNDLDYDDDVIFALDAYYTSSIEYIFKHFAKRFAEVESEFDAPLDIVLAGGTSMPEGFCGKVDEVVRGLDLPFNINEVRMAKDPRNAVVKGCLMQAMITQKKNKQS